MKNDVDILREAHQRINDALMVTSWWRANEVRDNYNLVDGDQWLDDTIARQNNDGMPIRTINKISPLIDAISGFEIQNRTKCEYIPRLPDKLKSGYSDLLNDAINYIQDESETAFHNSSAFRDMLTCGVGVTKTITSYDHNPDGDVAVKRIFPYFTLWDVAAREKNIRDANWVMYAKVVDIDSMEDYLKDAQEIEEADANFSASVDARFLDFFNVVMITKSLAIIYEYEWREKVPFYRVENPIIDMLKMEVDPEDPYMQSVIALAKTLKDKLKLEPTIDRVFSIEKEAYKDVKEAFEMLSLPFKATKQEKYKYYRATIIGNKIINKSENFSQNGFSLKFMTGKFSEVRQCYYGVVRACKEAQRLLNQSISDFEGFLRTIPKGGVHIEADAVPDMKGFLDTYTKAREVTVYNPGALTSGKMIPKVAPPIPSGLLDMINLAMQCIMEVTGVTPDFMGMTDSKLMTAQLNSQLVRQGLTVLSVYFDAKKQYMLAHGELFIDCVRIMAENKEGRLIRVIDKGEYKYIPLLKSGISAQYDVIVEEIAETPDEQKVMFERLLQFGSVLMNKPNPIDITPLILEYAPLKESQKEEIKALMQPVSPPPPDPVSQELLMAEAALKQQLAAKAEKEGIKTSMDILLKQQELMTGDEKNEAEVGKIISDTQLNMAKAHKEITR